MIKAVKGISTIFNLPEPSTGVLIRGSPNVFTNNRAAIRAGQDMATTCAGLTSHLPFPWPSPLVAEGSKKVYINGFPAARLNSKMVCGAHIKSGSPNVFIGGETQRVVFVWDFESWLHTGLGVLGLGALLGGAGYAAVAGWAVFGTFASITGGIMAGVEGLGQLGDSLGPGYRDLFQGTAGMALLLAGPKLAGWGKGQATEIPKNAGSYRPNRTLPTDEHGKPIPDSDSPHTQLGTRKGSKGDYTQAREWGLNSDKKLVPKRDIDFTDHGRPQNHTNPHQHDYIPNPTGGTPIRSPGKPLEMP